MIDIAIISIAVIFYLGAAIVLFKQLSIHTSEKNKYKPLILGLVATLFHADILARQIITDEGLQLGITHVASLATWFVACLLLIASFRKPIESLGIFVLPLAAITLVVEVLIPIDHIVSGEQHKGLGVHIVLSILAYSLLGLAAVQAVLTAIQERQLHNRQPGGLIRSLPPLETMETLLIQMITIGFALQTTSLISGAVYLDNMFTQNLAHKTILSISAWVVFAVLLFGRWRYGWRGRTIVRWTATGFVTLMLAYFGSKYVFEIILER